MKKGVRVGRIRRLWTSGVLDSKLVYFQVITNSRTCPLEKVASKSRAKVVRKCRRKGTLVLGY